jgi:hypothetical protein
MIFAILLAIVLTALLMAAYAVRKPKAAKPYIVIDETPRCKKCNRELVHPRFLWMVETAYFKDSEHECLKRTCGFCGYTWEEKCKDAS